MPGLLSLVMSFITSSEAMEVMETNCCVSGIEGSLKINRFNCYLDTIIAFWIQYYTGNFHGPSVKHCARVLGCRIPYN